MAKTKSHITLGAAIVQLALRAARHFPYLAIPLAAAGIAYAGVAQCGFIGFDDDLYVFENLIVSKGLTLVGLKWALTAFHASTWQPLVWLSFMLDVECFGINAHAMHITNLLLHLLNVALVYFCWALMTKHPWRAACVALIFAIHPIHVESVAWIAERKDVLSTALWWTSILAYIHYTQKRTVGRYGSVLACLTLGLLAKPMLITLPFALLLLDVWPLKRISFESLQGWRNALLEKLPLLAPIVVSAAITYHVQKIGGSVLNTATISIWGRFGNACVSYIRYIEKLLWPTRLAVLYPHPGAWNLFLVLASLVAILVALTWAWYRRAKTPWLWVGLLWYLVTLLPVIGLIQIGWHAMADRFMYVPAIGLYVALVWTIATGFERTKPGRTRTALVILSAAIIIALSARTRNQVSLWRDSVALFSHATHVTHDNWMMQNCCGAALARVGRDAEAVPHFEDAIRLRPERPRAYYNLGCVKFRQGNLKQAVRLFTQSAEMLPSSKTLYNLAVAQTHRGRFADAERTYLTLLEQTPDHTPTMNNLGCLYRELGRNEDAQILLEAAITINPSYLNAHYNLAITLMDKGKTVEAIKRFVYILEQDPNHAGARAGIRQAMQPKQTSATAPPSQESSLHDDGH